MIEGKKILIFGGSGSLGNALVQRYLDKNIIVVVSRGEERHWKMGMKYKSDNLRFIIGDVKNDHRMETCLLRENPNIIIYAAAMKHINMCEFAISECIMTNLMGIINVLNAIEKNQTVLNNLECLIYVSTDKACQSISSYGSSKFLGELVVIERSYYLKGIKLCISRYGNVINSSGSILKMLHKQINDPNINELTLTHEKMSRFLMTLDDSIDLLEYIINNAESGDIVVPKLISINIKDLFEIFSEKYNKQIKITGLRSAEKLLESLISPTESLSIIKNGEYYHIKPHYKKIIHDIEPFEYSSNINPLSKEQLKEFLIKLNLL